jgi:hypothetical protein
MFKRYVTALIMATALGLAGWGVTGGNAPNAGPPEVRPAAVWPRVVLAVNCNADKKLIILEEWLVDRSDPAKPQRYTQWRQFSLTTGRAVRPDGAAIAEADVWKQLPQRTSDRAKTVFLAADDMALTANLTSALKEDAIILVGESTLLGVYAPPEARP